MELANIVWLTDSKSQERALSVIKIEKISGDHAPVTPRSLRLRHSFCSKSVNIFPRSAPVYRGKINDPFDIYAE